MIKATINVPFEANLETDSNNYGYIDHRIATASCYASASKAKKLLKKALVEQVNDALEVVKNYRRLAIGTKQGEVFLVYFSHGSWHYSICGPDRKFSGSCSSRENFDETVSSAKRHIEQAFGGVAWECSY